MGIGENGGASLSDIAAVTKGGGGGWGDGLWVLVLFALIFGPMAFGGNAAAANSAALGYENYATSAEVQRGFDSQANMANQRDILAAVNSGTSQAVAATNQTFHDGVMALSDKYSELQRDIANVALQASQNRSGQQECCCNVLRAIDGVNYNGAQNASQVIAAVKDEGAQTRAMIQQDKVERMQQQMAERDRRISQLETQQQIQQSQAYSQQQFGAINSRLDLIPTVPTKPTFNAGSYPFCGCGCGAA